MAEDRKNDYFSYSHMFVYFALYVWNTKISPFFYANIHVPFRLFPQASATVTTRLYISPTGESSVVHKKKRKSVFCVNWEIKLD